MLDVCHRNWVFLHLPRYLPSFGRSFLYLMVLSLLAAAFAELDLSQQLLQAVEKHYGRAARQRLLDWQLLVHEHQNDAVVSKLKVVNQFFNKLEFVSDEEHWHKQDYWASPVEMLASNGGDCEDFSVAKYFTLLALGVDQRQLRITYVKAIELNQAHMVLTWYAQADAEPLVLDNLIDDIKPASLRADLLPVYSFNGADLWVAKERGKGALVGGSSQLAPWQALLTRMAKQQTGQLGE